MIPLENSNLLDFLVPSDEFRTMTLDRFCVKRHFEIGLVNTLTAQDEPFLNSIVSLNKAKEKITHLYFIRAIDVEDFVRVASTETKDFLFPTFLMGELEKFIQFPREACFLDPDIKDQYDAYAIKFKLTQVMYQQCSDEVRERKRREIRNRELGGLADKKSIGSRDKKRNIEAKSKQSTTSNTKRSREIPQEVDCAEIDIMGNDLVVDDVLKEQVNFYILEGYSNINLVNCLSAMNIKLSFILRISEYEPGVNSVCNKFWREIDMVRSVSCDYLQDIVLMKYQPPIHDENSSSLENHLKEIVNIVKYLIDLKRMHFHYVKELMLFDAKFAETITEFPVYHELMNKYPLETINVPLIIDGILREVQMKVDNILSSPNKRTKLLSKEKSYCPFDLIPKFRRPSEEKNETNLPYFKIYEKDYLNLTFNSYKVGYEYIKNNLSVLKLQLPVLLAEQCELSSTVDDRLSHAHHVCVPSNEKSIFTDEQVDYLINLLYLKNSVLRRTMQNKVTTNEFTENLIIHDENKYVKNSLPKFISEESYDVSGSCFNDNRDTNIYETINPLSLHWAEMLKPEVLFQYLLDSQSRYIYSDYIICEQTNSLIVRFHNNVDCFGLHTKVWKDYLRTPVGLGDFCKFVLTDDYEWLVKHKPYSQVTYVDVMKNLEEETTMRLYEDASNEKYKHLLLPQVQYSSSDNLRLFQCPCIENGEDAKIERNSAAESISHSVLSANLQNILNDLEEYKRSVDFSEHCIREKGRTYSFAAYNLGSTKFSVIGHTTNFISLDNVTVTVDSSRLCVENFKLTVKLLSDDNLLVLHTNQNNFNFHFLLCDGTIIFFSKPQIDKKTRADDTSSTFFQFQESTADIQQLSVVNSQLFHLNVEPEHEEDEKMLVAMDFHHYSSLELYPIVGNIIRETPASLHKTDIAKEIDILKRLQNEPNCIKVSRRPSLKHLKQIITENSVPVSSVVRRIINNPAKRQLCQPTKRKCVIKGELPPKKPNLSFDSVVTVPNGLTIKVQPSEILCDSSVIKQAYEYAAPPKNISDEKYRIFTTDGTIVIRKLDGTMVILTSSGREITFDETSDSEYDEKNCRPQKKFDENVIRKLLTRLMTNLPDQEDSDFYPSRRGHLHSKSKLVSNCPNLFELTKIPFSVVSMITLEGYKITSKKEKLFKVLHSRHMSEINFLTGQRHFKREDGFLSATYRDGSHYVEFPDGTSIKTIVHVGEELIKINEKDEMGWILVTSSFSYEHPFYKPTYFDNIKNIIKVRLNESQSLVIDEKGECLDMKNSIWDIRTDVISFTKRCERCDGSYKCELFVDPLYQNQEPDQDACFIVAEDSYNKTFKADFLGNCKVTSSYVRGAVNKNGCNHALLADHQKIYSIKKDLSGMLLWNDKKVTTAMKGTEEKAINHNFNDKKDTVVFVSITKDVSTNYSERFSGKIIREFDKYNAMLPACRPVLYQVTRHLYSMVDMAQIDDLSKCLRNFFSEEVEQELAESESALEFLKNYAKRSQSTFTHVSEDETKQTLSRMSIHARIMEMIKQYSEVKKIMQSPIPNYFNSSLCTFISNNTQSLTDNFKNTNGNL